MATVLAFGTFDRWHEGHRFFLSAAKALGDRLFVSVARDAHVRELKRKAPACDEQDRLARVREFPDVDEAVLSDPELGSFAIVAAVEPDVIAIGHDQDALERSLKEWLERTGKEIPIIRMERYETSDMGRN